MNQAERPINLRKPSKHEKAVLLQNYAAKRTSFRSTAVGPGATRRNTTGALTVNGSSARRLRTASVAVGLEAVSRPDGAPLEPASEPSLSCFGALCSVLRAATDYCRYGNLRQYLLIDPESGEPKHIYSAGR